MKTKGLSYYLNKKKKINLVKKVAMYLEKNKKLVEISNILRKNENTIKNSINECKCIFLEKKIMFSGSFDLMEIEVDKKIKDFSYSNEEYKILKQLYNSGKSIDYIVELLKKSKESIKWKIKKHNLRVRKKEEKIWDKADQELKDLLNKLIRMNQIYGRICFKCDDSKMYGKLIELQMFEKINLVEFKKEGKTRILVEVL